MHTKILIGLVIGAVAGLALNLAGADALIARLTPIAEPLGKIFLRLILMVVVPLVFSALVLGVLEMGDVRRLGRVGIRTLVLTLVFSLIAVGIGLGLVNFIQPGLGVSPETRDELGQRYAAAAGQEVVRADKAKSLADTLLDMIPANPLQEMVGALDGSSPGNGMLAVMFFALIFGVALSVTPDRTGPLVGVIQGVFDVTMTIIGFAMALAPFGVACLMFVLTARLGIDILEILVWFVLTVLLGLGLQMFVTYPIALRTLARRNPVVFFRQISEAIVTAFGTSSSNATLPTAIRVAEEQAGIPRDIARFVLTVGATGNQNGTALYEGVVVLFLAQVFGVELSLSQQITVVLMSVLAGVGTAGVPGGSIPLIIIVMNQVGVPSEGIGIILGVDRVLDMCRTTLNVTGDLTLAACVARSDSTFAPETS